MVSICPILTDWSGSVTMLNNTVSDRSGSGGMPNNTISDWSGSGGMLSTCQTSRGTTASHWPRNV